MSQASMKQIEDVARKLIKLPEEKKAFVIGYMQGYLDNKTSEEPRERRQRRRRKETA